MMDLVQSMFFMSFGNGSPESRYMFKFFFLSILQLFIMGLFARILQNVCQARWWAHDWIFEFDDA